MPLLQSGIKVDNVLDKPEAIDPLRIDNIDFRQFKSQREKILKSVIDRRYHCGVYYLLVFLDIIERNSDFFNADLSNSASSNLNMSAIFGKSDLDVSCS